MLAHLVGDRSGRPNDNALRARVNEAGIYVTTWGFHSPNERWDVVAISRWKKFPDHISVPVEDVARKVYLLMSALDASRCRARSPVCASWSTMRMVGRAASTW